MQIHCVGCGRRLFEWDGGTLAYTCSCDAVTFSKVDPMTSKGTDEELDQLILPASFWRYAAGEVDDIPHLEYYLGTSNAVNPLKTKLREKLKEVGAISQADCVVCKSRIRQVARNP